jgi:asparagine synthase (glutamine-hydrolysing)
MNNYGFELFQGDLPPGQEYSEWINSWWFRSEGIPIAKGEIKGKAKWLLAGWMLNNQNTNDIVEVFLSSRNVEYLYSIDGHFILSIYYEFDRIVEIYRDRVGTFPLVYENGPKSILISVGIESIKQLSHIDTFPSPAFSEQWPLYRKTFSPYSPFKDIKGLAAENSLMIKDSSLIENVHPMHISNKSKFITMNASSEILGEILSQSVQKRIDVSKRMGVFLSGGTDSSLIVALVRKYYSGSLKTLFVTFEDNSRDYGHYAKYIADRYSTDHSSEEIGPREYVAAWAQTIDVLQTPVPMPCHIGIYHALKMLSGNVDLMIDGDGADTVFGSSIWPQMIFLSQIGTWIPQFFKNGLGKLTKMIPGETLLGRVMHMSLIAMQTPLYIYPHVNAAMISENEFNNVFLKGKWWDAVAFRQSLARGDFFTGFFSYLMLHGIPEDLATTVRLGLSQRIFFTYPFLDYTLLQESLRLPNRLRYHYRLRKAPLKKYSERFFDKKFIYKPKEGFGVPLSKWFIRKEFEPFLHMPLESRSLKRGWWNEKEVRRIIKLHVEGNGNDSTAESIPWIIINMELWARICIDGDSTALYK